MKFFVGTENTSAESQCQDFETHGDLLTIYFLKSELFRLSDEAEDHEPRN